MKKIKLENFVMFLFDIIATFTELIRIDNSNWITILVFFSCSIFFGIEAYKDIKEYFDNDTNY